MAPGRLSKRPRAATNDIASTTSYGKAAQNGRGKRPRRSSTKESESNETSEIESNRSDSEEAPEDHHNTVEDVEDLFLRATQRVERQFRNNEQRQNVPSESGIIEEIRCTNFMCHEQLTITLGPLINFIIGHNGSGKSAVLTSLTLCLGGKASATNRGQNLKAFIKEGRDHCNISVKIKNQGSAAYRPDTYGSSIIVERHFNRAGASGFKLRDMNGKVVSTKRQDLEDIIDAFALQIDNPMNVLTQDMARQFLNDSTPKDKYKFFLKGTQLETLQADYRLIMTELEEMESKSHTVKADVESLRKRYETAKEKARAAANLENMKMRERELAHQAAWSKVEEEEEALNKIDGEIDRVNRLIENRNATADEHSAAYENANLAFSDQNQAKEDKEAELGPLQDEVDGCNGQWSETKAKLLRIKAQERDVAGRIRSKVTAIRNFQSEIQEHRQRQAEADDGQHAQKVRELEEAKEDCNRAKQDLTDHTAGLQSHNDELQKAQKQLRPAGEKENERKIDVQRSDREIKELEQGQRNWVEAYPMSANLQRLLKLIEQDRRFRDRPVGPMGRHVKLLKPEWSSILEKSFGASLNAFVVTSKADQSVLSDLMRKTNCHQYPIFIGQSSRIDTSGNEPDAQLDTWLRVLKIDDDVVRNQLIINHGIDQTALIAKREEAENLMYQGGPSRRNVRICFTMSDQDPRRGHAISVNDRTGAVNLGPIMPWTFQPRMQADKEPQLRVARSNLEHCKKELDSAVAEMRSVQTRIQTCKRNIHEHSRQGRNLNVAWQQAQENVERLEAELSAATPDDGMIEQLEAMLQEAENEKGFEEGQYQDIVVQGDELDKQAKAYKRSLEDVQRRIGTVHMELGKARSKADQLKNKREEALRNKNEALEQVQAAQDNKTQWDQARGAQQAKLEGVASEAGQICARVQVPQGETHDRLMKKLERVQQRREQNERELGGSQQELTDAAVAAKKALSDAYKELANTEQLIKTLGLALRQRQDRWDKFRQEISIRARVIFGYLLSERQFRGDLKVDHHTQQLDIQVQPDITIASGAGRQTKTLSGGEKSFSTICLLLSLWDAMGSPIRCLDEFDVFMDSVNRDISMKMMIGAARRAIGRQYILITPQAMNSFQSAGDVKIIRMADPDRGQTALNIGRR